MAPIFVAILCFLGCGKAAPPAATTSGEAKTNATVETSVQFGEQQAPGNQQDAPSTGNSTWPVFRGNATSDGVATSTLPPEPTLIWKRSIKDGMFEATPAIVDGVVYIGGLNGYFYALDLKSGEEKWGFFSELGFRAPAAVRDGLVYVGDTEGRFVCLDAATGESKWGLSTDAEINAGANFYQNNVIIGSQNGTLYALDAKTGKEAWKYSIDNMIQCSPTIVENRVFLAGCDSVLHIIDLDNGQRVAQVEIGDPTGVTPAAVGDMVYFATQGARVFCVNWRQAKVVWTYEHDKKKSPYQSSPAVGQDMVVIGGRDRMIHGLRATTGDEAWIFPTKRVVDASPVIVGDRVFVGAGDGRVYGLKLASGEKVWEYEAGGDFIGSPAVAAGRMVVAGGNGDVFCFGPGEK
ncbi:MAG TPA: PQQ-binding-like beta-propeller repeat protein [Pirellulales bacterium]|jgi:outer membrane protein assembly factor BamB